MSLSFLTLVLTQWRLVMPYIMFFGKVIQEIQLFEEKGLMPDGNKPLAKPMLVYCQLRLKHKNFH